MDIQKLLAEIPLFEDMSPSDLAIVAEHVRLRRLREGDTILHRSDPGAALYIIVKGKVKIHNEAPDGTESIITILTDGEFLGELAILDGNERSADATTMEPTEIMILTKDDLYTIMDRFPRISVGLLQTLAGRLRRTTEAFVAASTLEVHGRLALQLLRLAEQLGVVTRDGTRIDFHLTQSDLGALVGASRERVNMVLGFFRRQGYIEVDEKGRIVIRDPAALERLCS